MWAQKKTFFLVSAKDDLNMHQPQAVLLNSGGQLFSKKKKIWWAIKADKEEGLFSHIIFFDRACFSLYTLDKFNTKPLLVNFLVFKTQPSDFTDSFNVIVLILLRI